MESSRVLRNSQIVILGICIAVATIASSVILSKGFLKVMKFTREQIAVTGSAQKDIKSDYIVWTASFSKRGPDSAAAYKLLKEDLVKVKKYLVAKGVDDNKILVYQVVITTVYKKNEKGNDTSDIQGYVLTQSIQIKSDAVDMITQLSRESTELIDQGTEFSSGAPEYYYTKLDELKIEMLAKATQNAKQRAENMARATGNRIGLMRSAKMGVFQITPINSTEVSDWGVNDATSLEKKVTAVVTVSFAIE
jgi:hypothetical protein